MGWTDSDLRYLRANIMFDALPPREQAVIGLPPCPSPRCLEMEAVIAAAQLVAEKTDQSRDSLPSLLRRLLIRRIVSVTACS